MNNRKVLLFTLPILLALFGLFWLSGSFRNQPPADKTQIPPTTDTQAKAESEIGPIVVARFDQQPDKTVFIARDLSTGMSFPELDLPSGTWSNDQPVLADKKILSVFGDNVNNLVLYKVASGNKTEFVQLMSRDIGTGLFWSDYLLVIPPKANVVQLIRPDFDQFQISLDSKYINDGIHHVINVFNGNKGELVAFSYIPLYENNQYFVLVWVIHPKKATIEERKLLFLDARQVNTNPFPNEDQKHNVVILAISQDFTKVVYTYDYIKKPFDNMIYEAYAVYSTTERKDLLIVKDRFFLPKFDQVGDIIYQEKYRVNGSGGVILNLVDLSPVIDIEKFVPPKPEDRIHISPYGSNWLIGTDDEIFLVSSSGKVIKKFPLPADFVGQEYQIVRPVTE
ncbi:MAG: hypothetical protein ABFD05_04605 [Anaerolineaceae bacterium]